MDFGKTNEALNSNGRDFDLNIPYSEDLDLNPTNEFSPPIPMNTQQASQSSTENMKKEATSKGDNEVQQPSTVDTTILANSGVSSEDMRHVEPKFVASISFASASLAQRGRRRRRRRIEVRQSDPDRYCTNFCCKTRKTPMWRKGPLGPKTLCNACGLQYIKMVSSRGSGISLHAGEGDASPASVPAETVEGSSNF